MKYGHFAALLALAGGISPAVAAEPPPGVTADELPGTGSIPGPPQARARLPAHGDVAFNLPATDVRVVAKAVLGDILHVPYAVAPGLTTQLSAVTPYPIARSSVLPFLEETLRSARLALVRIAGTYTIMSSDAARGAAAPEATPGAGVGFASDIIHLHFVSAAEIKALLEPILPGVVAATDPLANTVTLAGTSGQRASARDIVSEFDVNWLRKMSFALYIPQHSDSRLIVPELEKVLNAPDAPTRSMVRLIAMDKLNGILAVTAQSQYLDDVRRWIEVLDREGQNDEQQLFVYRVQNGRSKDLAKTLNLAFGMGGGGGSENGDHANGGTENGSQPPPASAGASLIAPPQPPAPAPTASGAQASGQHAARRLDASISSDDNNNAVVIYGTPHDYGVILSALHKLDIAPIQVMIEAAITEVTLTNDMSYGVQWQFGRTGVNSLLTQSSTTDPAHTSITNFASTAPGFSMLFTHGTNIAALLSSLQTHTKINVVSAPKLMVLNNQTAALQVGDQVPILTQSATTVIAGSAVVNSVDYKDTGVILKITPRVNESGMVLLDISQEVSSVSTTTTSSITSPTISTRKIATSVAVHDDDVIALGGMIIDNSNVTKSGLPIISQIPIIGSLFGNHQTTKTRTELIVLLKPHVVRSESDEDSVTAELRKALQATQKNPAAGAEP